VRVRIPLQVWEQEDQLDHNDTSQSVVTHGVGRAVGCCSVGVDDGCSDGEDDGCSVGTTEGCTDGDIVGSIEVTADVSLSPCVTGVSGGSSPGPATFVVVTEDGDESLRRDPH
jgi:hypothetical protein